MLESFVEMDTERIAEKYIDSTQYPICIQMMILKADSYTAQKEIQNHDGATFMFELSDKQGRSLPVDEMDPQENVKMQFAPHFFRFSANQTVCMSFQEDNRWTSSTCQTSVDATSNSVSCSCSMIGSQMFSLKTNTTRESVDDIQWNIDYNLLSSTNSQSLAYVVAALILLVYGVGG